MWKYTFLIDCVVDCCPMHAEKFINILSLFVVVLLSVENRHCHHLNHTSDSWFNGYTYYIYIILKPEFNTTLLYDTIKKKNKKNLNLKFYQR